MTPAEALEITKWLEDFCFSRFKRDVGFVLVVADKGSPICDSILAGNIPAQLFEPVLLYSLEALKLRTEIREPKQPLGLFS